MLARSLSEADSEASLRAREQQRRLLESFLPCAPPASKVSPALQPSGALHPLFSAFGVLPKTDYLIVRNEAGETSPAADGSHSWMTLPASPPSQLTSSPPAQHRRRPWFPISPSHHIRAGGTEHPGTPGSTGCLLHVSARHRPPAVPPRLVSVMGKLQRQGVFSKKDFERREADNPPELVYGSFTLTSCLHMKLFHAIRQVTAPLSPVSNIITQ